MLIICKSIFSNTNFIANIEQLCFLQAMSGYPNRFPKSKEEKQIEVMRSLKRGIYMRFPHPLYDRQKSEHCGYACYRSSPFEWDYAAEKWVDVYQPTTYPPIYEILQPEQFGLSPDGPKSANAKESELKTVPKSKKKFKKGKVILSTALPLPSQ
jgi:hypothetical protein